MRAGTASIAIMFAIMAPPAPGFDKDEFCLTVTEIARRMDARKGTWLDRSTRHGGVVVDCEFKTLEVRRFLNASPDAMRQGWDGRKERDWNAVYCNDDGWRGAINNGWSIISTLTFRTGEQMSFVAMCEQ